MHGSETGESATLVAEAQDAGSETPRNPLAMRVAVLALVVATVATVAATAVMVISHPDPVRPEPVRPSASAPTTVGPLPTTQPPLPISTSQFTGMTVGEAVPRLEAAGAKVELYDVRLWDRPVAPEWHICIASELFFGDTPSSIVQISAVPAGDPCPDEYAADPATRATVSTSG